MLDVDEAHRQITTEITQTRQKEMKDLVAMKRHQRHQAEQRLPDALKHYKAAGLDVTKLEAYHETMAKERADELAQIKKQHAGKPNEPKVLDPEHFRAAALDAAIAPADARELPPAWAAVFST